MTVRGRILGLLTVTIMVALSTACSTTGVKKKAGADTQQTDDPFEKINRVVYKWNINADKHFLKPVAEAYDRNVPGPIKAGISNFFFNALEPSIVINDFLQGKFQQCLTGTGRFVVNTTVGLLGTVDVATKMGLKRHEEDFGQTLAVWGMAEGPFIMIPFLGPSNLRDGLGMLFYYRYFYPFAYLKDGEARWAAVSLDMVSWRTKFLGAGEFLDQATLDPYTFTREAYSQRRRYLIYDGNPPVDYLLED